MHVKYNFKAIYIIIHNLKEFLYIEICRTVKILIQSKVSTKSFIVKSAFKNKNKTNYFNICLFCFKQQNLSDINKFIE